MSYARIAVIGIALGLVVHVCPAGADVPPLADLLDRYTQALDATQSFISTWERTSVGSSNVPSWGLKATNAKKFARGEHRTDGKGNRSGVSYEWGHRSGEDLTEDKARYFRNVYGDGFIYRLNKGLGQDVQPGQLTYQDESSKDFETYRQAGGYYARSGTTGYFLGYFQTRARLDRVLKKALRISVRRTPARINGSLCYVVQASTRRGRFTVWLDSEHGYHPARIEGYVGPGDDIGDPGSLHIISRKEAITRRYTVENVRFERVGGVWVPMEADAKTHIVLGYENGFSTSDVHFRRTKIVLNPDHDALQSFGDPTEQPHLDPQLTDGTIVHGQGPKSIWRSGRIVPLAQAK